MKPPAFRFYPSDFWASPDVQAMDLHEVGAYVALISSAWLSDRPGCLKDEEEKLRRWSRMTREQWRDSRQALLSKFPVIEEGWRGNPRLIHEARKQDAYSASQSAKGKLGGRPKAGDKPQLTEEKPTLSPGLSPEKPSVSVSVSASVFKNKELFAPAPQAPSAQDSRPKAKTPSEEELVWEAYPVKKGKSKAVPIIRKILADLCKAGEANPGELLVERIRCWEANRQKKQAANDFVPEMPYPQKFFGRGDWNDEDALPRPKAVFVEVSPEEWHGQKVEGE